MLSRLRFPPPIPFIILCLYLTDRYKHYGRIKDMPNSLYLKTVCGNSNVLVVLPSQNECLLFTILAVRWLLLESLLLDLFASAKVIPWYYLVVQPEITPDGTHFPIAPMVSRVNMKGVLLVKLLVSFIYSIKELSSIKSSKSSVLL